MADIVRYFDTGSDAGGDGTTTATSSGDNTHAYQSMNQWEAAEETDLDTANNTHTAHGNRTNSGGIDTTSVVITGWTTSAADFLTIIIDDFPADGIFDNTKYLLHNNDSGTEALGISEDYVRIVNLQIQVTETSTNTRYGIYVTSVGTGDIRIDSCILKGVVSGTGVGNGIRVTDADAILTVYNTVVYDFFIADDSGFVGITSTSSTTFLTYNCTVSNCYRGIDHQSVAGSVSINCAVFNNTDDFAFPVTVDYCASDDGDGTNAVDISPGGVEVDDWNNAFTDYSNGDFSVKDASSVLYQTGNGATPKSIFTDDIIGITRDAVDLNWDIGAFEFVVTGANPKGPLGHPLYGALAGPI